MRKILINELKQEISSFNPFLCQYKDWVTLVGPAVLAFHQGLGTEVAGALSVFAQHPELEVVAGAEEVRRHSHPHRYRFPMKPIAITLRSFNCMAKGMTKI